MRTQKSLLKYFKGNCRQRRNSFAYHAAPKTSVAEFEFSPADAFCFETLHKLEE